MTSLKLVAYNASSGFQSAQFPTKSGCFNSEVPSLSIQGQLHHLLTMKSDFSHQISENMKSYFRNHFSEIRLQTSMLEMSLANRFKNLYRGQLFIFCLRRRRRFFYLKISLLEMLIAVGNEHLKNIPLDVRSTIFQPEKIPQLPFL